MVHHLQHAPPPGRAAAPAATGAASRSGLEARLGLDGTPSGYPSSPTLAFLHGRERVLGRRFMLHQDPAVAAARLVEELGSLGARRWLLAALAEVR